MWSRTELKSKAKIAFKRNYWKCVLVAFVLALVVEGGSTLSVSEDITSSISSINESDDYYDDYYDDDTTEDYYDDYYEDDSEGFVEDVFGGLGISSLLMSIGVIVLLIVFVAAAALKILVFNPLEVGGCRFFIENSYEKAPAGKLGFAFKKGTYGNTVLTIFLRNLYIALWTLLLVVPGVIKRYEYRMVPYLLADDPNMPREDAFRISKEMMNGQKMDAFVLDLSFFGWDLLSVLSLGLAGIFWVNPYEQATNAELFLNLRNQYFQKQNHQSTESQNNDFWSESI